MARRKRSRAVKTRRVYMAAPKRSKSRKSGSSKGMNNMTLMFSGAAYGATRSYIGNLLAPVAAKIPLGQYADEAVLIGAALAAKKFSKNRHVHNFANAAIVLESAFLGSQLAQRTVTTQSSSVVLGQ